MVLRDADVPPVDRAWFGAVPTTNPTTVAERLRAGGLSPALLQQAAQPALRRGLVTNAELGDVEATLRPFGGLTV